MIEHLKSPLGHWKSLLERSKQAEKKSSPMHWKQLLTRILVEYCWSPPK